jgi:hypothetical protein
VATDARAAAVPAARAPAVQNPYTHSRPFLAHIVARNGLFHSV